MCHANCVKCEEANHLLVVARATINALIKEREWMACQLGHALELMTDADLKEAEDEYFADNIEWCHEDLLKRVALLIKLVPPGTDAEHVSVMLGCPIDQAERAMAEISSKVGCL
jgi:hypothetical protein